MAEQSDVLTTREIAALERISVDTVWRALKNGHLRGHQIGSRGDWRIRRADYEEWIRSGAHTEERKG